MHLALGYSSWRAYCKAEFGLSKSAAYRMLDNGRVLRVLADSPDWVPAQRRPVARA